MNNSNGPPKGFNVTSDQASYDIVTKDIIICSNLGTSAKNGTLYSFNINDNINQIYKAELISAAIKFNIAINANVINKTLLVNIPQLNQNTFYVATNTSGKGGIGDNSSQSQIFCQIPENCTPVTPGSLVPNNIISLYIGARMFDTVQYYNPPINKLNKLQISFFDPNGNVIPVSTTGDSGTIYSFYFTLRLYYFQKRNTISSFSTSVINYTGSGTIDTNFG